MEPREDRCIAVVGLGYVGLPLAIAFAARHRVIGLDIDEGKIGELKNGFDRMREVPGDELGVVEYSSDPARLAEAGFVIVCVPTPIDRHNNPDLSLVEGASRMIGQHLRRGATVILESTVYPGVTEEVMKPALESASGMHCPTDFLNAFGTRSIRVL